MNIFFIPREGVVPLTSFSDDTGSPREEFESLLDNEEKEGQKHQIT